MKIKIKIKIMLLLVSFFLVNGNVYGADIVNIVPQNLKNINFEITPKISLSNGSVNSEIKVLKDLQITSSSKDFKDSNKVILNFKNALIPNRSYNLLSIFGVDGNIDFSVGSEFTLLDIKNPNNVLAVQGIARLLIIDSRTIDVYFNNPIDATEFEFKLFRESLVNETTSSGSILSITLNDSLDKSSSYILMMISLSNKYGLDVKFDQEIYDFTTSATLGDKKINENTKIIEKKAMQENGMNGSGELTMVALNSAVTPDTGPETWILIFLTLMVNVVLIVRKKLVK